MKEYSQEEKNKMILELGILIKDMSFRINEPNYLAMSEEQRIAYKENPEKWKQDIECQK